MTPFGANTTYPGNNQNIATNNMAVPSGLAQLAAFTDWERQQMQAMQQKQLAAPAPQQAVQPQQPRLTQQEMLAKQGIGPGFRQDSKQQYQAFVKPDFHGRMVPAMPGEMGAIPQGVPMDQNALNFQMQWTGRDKPVQGFGAARPSLASSVAAQEQSALAAKTADADKVHAARQAAAFEQTHGW